MISIESEDNPRLKMMRRLLTARGIRKEGMALFAGRKIIPELIAQHPERIELCALRGDQPVPDGLPGHALNCRIRPALFNAIDPAGTRGPVLMARTPELPQWQPGNGDGLTLLAGFQDPVNLGAAIRLSAAFQVAQTVLLSESAHPFLPRSIRGAGPAVFTTPLATGPSMARLSGDGQPLIVLSPSGEPLPGFSFPASCTLLAGLEGPGLPEDLPPHTPVTIPMAAGVESLNAATAVAIALYAYRLQFPSKAPSAEASHFEQTTPEQ